MSRRNRRPDFNPAALPPGAIVREIKLPARKTAKPAVVPELPDGSIIAAFSILGRARSWCAPTVTKKGHPFKSPVLVAWQTVVAARAKEFMAGRPPYPHPVELILFFNFAPRSQHPDTTNLVKAAEDALQGIVISNDREVRSLRARKIICDCDWVQVIVRAITITPGRAEP